MRNLFLALLLTGCAMRPNPNPPPDEINSTVYAIEQTGEVLEATEDVLICGSDLAREWVFEPIGNLLSSIVPFFANADSICEEE